MKTKWPAFGFSCLLLAGVAAAIPSANAQVAHQLPASTGAAAASISSVEVAQPGNETTVRISGTGELHYQASRLDSPPRLVLDFTSTALKVEKNKVQSEFAPVLGVRLGQPAPGESRVVIDLAKQSLFTAAVDGSSVTISFAASEATAAPAAFHPAKKPAAKLSPVKVPSMPLPTWLTGKDAGFAAPASEPVPPQPQNPQMAQPPAAAPAAAPEKKFTGDPISVNLKDVDLKDFFRLIHEISGLNIVLDPSVHGTVTLVLDQVPWDQALEIVLRNNGLTKEIDGNVLRIATQDTLKREADQRRELAKAESDAVEMVTVTRVLNYAQANTMVTTLKKFLTSRGDVFADIRSNTLIIRDIPSSIPKIDNLLRQIDRKSQQVEIDARVVQTSRNFAREIGTEFGFSAPTGVTGNTAIGGLTGGPAFLSPVIHSIAAPFSTGAGGGGQIPLNTSLGATSPTSGFTFATQGHNYAIDFVLSLMESRGVGKILSEPKGITQNNEKLTVKQGQQIPIQTNINNTISTQYVDAVLKLEVTPQITAEGTVFLDVTIENTQIDKAISVQGEPGLDTQSTQTKVIVADGGTVVIGGVVITNQNTTIDQVPLLGNVPLIGNLFKHTSISVSTQELMFFVTPRILPG
ncbi:MAG TPA: type IV pilus secretin PilQ [Candidatus Acidoferrales bacterium]|jgi:type IV pilus assembly protein PilQ|nr:type IV pilus secretin PilQ [Candidatus Acidoferrales bacterium]